MKTIALKDYQIRVGSGLLGEVASLCGGADRVAIIAPAALEVSAEAIREDLGSRAVVLVVPDAEEQKQVDVVAFCWARLADLGFTRNDIVIGLGGGATTDLAGFVAATWLRGIRWIAIPTTMAGMVDAAIGGKTGINLSAGKNLVGAFHSPQGVICDLNALETLPHFDLVAGLAEVIKCGFIADPSILDLIEADPAKATALGTPELQELIVRAIEVKARVVDEDFRESGLREILNYGHTLGHAIEHHERYQWRHGAAVSVGMVFAAELARLSGRLDEATADRHRKVLQSVGLPVSYRADAWPALLEVMKIDKKARGSLLRFVILEGLARPGRLEGPDPAVLAAAYGEISREQ